MFENFDAEQSTKHLQELRQMVAGIRGESVQPEKEEENTSKKNTIVYPQAIIQSTNEIS